MKTILKGKSMVLVSTIFIVILCSIIFILVRIGGAYKSGLSRFSQDEQISDVTHTERQKIRKITIKNKDDDGCMEVTPDGVIRFFADCEKELISAQRVIDTRYILKLYKKVSETDLSKFSDESNVSCEGRLMTIETDEGSRNVCLQITTDNGTSTMEQTNNGGSGVSSGQIDRDIGEIITIIDQITDNIPSTPTPVPSAATPTETIGTGGTIAPTMSVLPSWGVTPTPLNVISQPFECEYTDSQGKKRPYTISNIICSSEPSAAPTPFP